MTVRPPSPLLFTRRILRRFVEEDFDQISGSLAYTTLLSLVPLVAVILGTISLAPSFLGMVNQLDQFVARTLLPRREAAMIIGYILEFSQKAGNVTLVGLGVLITTVYLLLQTIERAFNRVWSVVENRPRWKQLRLYTALLILWPLVVAGVITAISYGVTISIGLADAMPGLRNLLFKVTGFSISVIFFAGLYFSVPNTRVAARDSLWAGLFATVGFQLMQYAFEFYLSNFPSYTVVYGAFATVPIFLLWLYLSWAVVLLGALVAATLPEFRAGQARNPER